MTPSTFARVDELYARAVAPSSPLGPARKQVLWKDRLALAAEWTEPMRSVRTPAFRTGADTQDMSACVQLLGTGYALSDALRRFVSTRPCRSVAARSIALSRNLYAWGTAAASKAATAETARAATKHAAPGGPHPTSDDSKTKKARTEGEPSSTAAGTTSAADGKTAGVAAPAGANDAATAAYMAWYAQYYGAAAAATGSSSPSSVC